MKQIKMLGALAGDIIGSPYELGGMKRRDFKLQNAKMRVTGRNVVHLGMYIAQ